MVYRPGHPRGPAFDKNKWNVRCKDWIEFNKNPSKVRENTDRLVEEINDLIHKEGREKDVAIISVSSIGLVQVKCDPEFGKRLGELPAAEGSEFVVFRYPMGKPGGPR